jgi:hypothetical protein
MKPQTLKTALGRRVPLTDLLGLKLEKRAAL